MHFLFVDFDSYFASCEQQLRPELRGLPLGVVAVMTETTCCIAASYEAKAFGVKTGTGVREARLLCPQIRFVQARPKEYVRIHHRAVATVESCIPVAGVQSIDELYAELPPSWRNTAKINSLAQQIRRRLAEDIGEHIGCSIGAGPNVFLSKIASGMNKPRGLTLLSAASLPAALHSLELRDIHGIGANMERRLRSRGITTVAALCAADRHVLHSAWGGIGGERIYAQLRGEIVEPRESQRKSLGHSHVLSPELRNLAGAFSVLHRLTQKAAFRLRREGLHAGDVQVSVVLQNRERWKKSSTLFPTNQTREFLDRLGQLWQQFPRTQVSPPMKVAVTFGDLIPDALHTPSLFDQETDQRNTALEQAMDVINTRFGSTSLYYAGAHRGRDQAPARIAFNYIPDTIEAS